MTRHCTIPNILGIGKWYERNYSACCKVHDKHYEDRIGKVRADWLFTLCVLQRASMKPWGRRLYHYPFAVAGFVVLTLVGWWHYYDIGSKIKSFFE